MLIGQIDKINFTHGFTSKLLDFFENITIRDIIESSRRMTVCKARKKKQSVNYLFAHSVHISSGHTRPGFKLLSLRKISHVSFLFVQLQKDFQLLARSPPLYRLFLGWGDLVGKNSRYCQSFCDTSFLFLLSWVNTLTTEASLSAGQSHYTFLKDAKTELLIPANQRDLERIIP